MKKPSPSIRRRNHKWAMVGHKGGKCMDCELRVTLGNIEIFQFDHKVQVNNHNDKTDRWGGGICDWPPFTDKWFAWAQTVELICPDCHLKRHKQDRQLSLIDVLVQARLDAHPTDGPQFTRQIDLFTGT